MAATRQRTRNALPVVRNEPPEPEQPQRIQLPPKTPNQRRWCDNMWCRPFVIAAFRDGDLVEVVVHHAKDRRCKGREDPLPVEDWRGDYSGLTWDPEWHASWGAGAGQRAAAR